MKFFAAVLQWQSFFRHWKSLYFWTTAWMEPYSDYRPYYCTKSSHKKSWRSSKACQGVWNFECFTWQVMWHSSSSKSFRHGFKLKLWLWDIARKHVVEIYATWKKVLGACRKGGKAKARSSIKDNWQKQQLASEFDLWVTTVNESLRQNRFLKETLTCVEDFSKAHLWKSCPDAT